MRNVPLAELITRLKAEIGAALDDGTASDALLTEALRNKQLWLAASYAWPFLKKQWDVTANARYVVFPTTDVRSAEAELDTDAPYLAKVKHNTTWIDLEYGIGPDELNIYDSDEGETSSPIQKFEFRETSQTLECEFWPVPSETQTVRIWGQKKLADLEDGCELDDLLLIYSTASELLARFDQKDAQLKARLANNRLLQLQAKNPQPLDRVIFGKNDPDAPKPVLVKIAVG